MFGLHIAHSSFVKRLLIGCVMLVPATPGAALAQPSYSGIVVFGTSLSDSGNAFALRGGANTPPDYLLDPLLVPSAPYARGGHHFSNGATWVEQFARSLGLAGSVRPAYRGASAVATNFAVGAARAYDDGKNVNLSDQVEAFLQSTGGVASPSALYVIEMGGNDVRDALGAFPTGHTVILERALGAIAANVGRLYGAGARHFLVWSAPNPALTPAIRRLATVNPGVAQLAAALTQSFNVNLAGILTQLSALPGIDIDGLDAYTLLNEIVADGTRFGLTNVTEACITPYEAPFACTQPDEFLFWDGIHPTAAVHGIVAQLAASVLSQ
jgi:phospholipase/lecithinase/hemolysin